METLDIYHDIIVKMQPIRRYKVKIRVKQDKISKVHEDEK